MYLLENIPYIILLNCLIHLNFRKKKQTKLFIDAQFYVLIFYKSDLIASLYSVLMTVTMTSVLSLALSKSIKKIYGLYLNGFLD